MKTCTGCKKPKPLGEFWKDSRRPNGLMARCKACKDQMRKNYYANNPGYHKKRYWKNRDSERERHLKKKYGITLQVYAKMLEEQCGSCAVCGRPEPPNKTLDVDHDHATGKVRGLLCTSCNRMIGHAHDSVERLCKAASYLVASRDPIEDLTPC